MRVLGLGAGPRLEQSPSPSAGRSSRVTGLEPGLLLGWGRGGGSTPGCHRGTLRDGLGASFPTRGLSPCGGGGLWGREEVLSESLWDTLCSEAPGSTPAPPSARAEQGSAVLGQSKEGSAGGRLAVARGKTALSRRGFSFRRMRLGGVKLSQGRAAEQSSVCRVQECCTRQVWGAHSARGPWILLTCGTYSLRPVE